MPWAAISVASSVTTTSGMTGVVEAVGHGGRWRPATEHRHQPGDPGPHLGQSGRGHHGSARLTTRLARAISQCGGSAGGTSTSTSM